MKTIYRSVVVAASLSVACLAATANASQHFTPEFEKALVSVCRTAVDNDRRGLRKAVRNVMSSRHLPGPTYRSLAKGLVCNGMPVMDFAQQYGAAATLAVFTRYTPSSIKTKIEIKDVVASSNTVTDIDVAWETANE